MVILIGIPAVAFTNYCGSYGLSMGYDGPNSFSCGDTSSIKMGSTFLNY